MSQHDAQTYQAELEVRQNAEAETERREAIPQFMACRAAFIDSHMQLVGIAPHEITARWEMVPDAIKKAIPEKWGFGLSGGFGVGKTFALVAKLRNKVGSGIDAHMAKMVEKGEVYDLMGAIRQKGLGLRPYALWCNWPGEVAARRAQLFRNQHSEVEDWIQALQDPERLVFLDDLGASKATAQDWEGETLARVIDERLRHEAITVWTSNHDKSGLIERYGPRTFSRLQALAPVIRLPKLDDLRVCPKPPLEGPQRAR